MGEEVGGGSENNFGLHWQILCESGEFDGAGVLSS